MTLVTSALRIGTTLVSVAHRAQVTLLLSTSRPKAISRVETSAQLRHKESRRSPTWSARYTLRGTTRRSRLMCSEAGCISKTLVSVPSMPVKVASPKCSSMTMQTRFRWVRASTRRRNSMTLQGLSAASAKTSRCPRMRLLQESDQGGRKKEQMAAINHVGKSRCSVEKHIAQKV